ncbi:PAS domain S-box-containing protein/putative nucleotidyltransferase with HDIG domain [Halanaerobium saccharolyticum]|uniref:PAS domain S-box-containing protein/putative nucleotidyltransferase with HDIG domain n=1 Tax=Halanaerobium saccharolyticum TaxID=43595 RepID=A0A4R7YWI2_9FIRM|nr:HD domain-containing phosphohydrolase [Halanaerobium saccharolyticum]RAK06930.1 PAS domain S-box-containing protein/putative nucleotidyltransferase with HDIG domain [Halanaerobium saccharolyticum]TDW01657.1 PAS domain S-box-containing protein/putative nucleotidyltransferase with HDIG domain [Halanaerobium saccharolyticum]TDX53055.1 PAS domain S-box-containing protein/putative nucleotidyltransferase with HDIG domain [Halanaerobium saccharolyticum]
MEVDYKEIENINLLDLGDHAVLFYEGNEELLSAIHAFIKGSLKNNEKCIYIDEKANQKKILAELNNSIGNIDDLLKSGQLQLFVLEKLYGNPDDFSADDMISLIETNVKLAKKEGYKGLSITGELKGVIDFNGGKEEIIKYEWKLHDQIFEKYPVRALCRYNINFFDNQTIKAAVELHDYIIWQGMLHENPYYINPEGYKQQRVEEYEIKSWLKNIQQYQKKETMYKKEINKSQQKYFELYNEAPIGIIKTNSKGQIIEANKKMMEMGGFDSIQEVLNNYADLGEIIYYKPDKRKEFLMKLNKNGEIKNFEFRARKKDGKIIWLNMSSKIIERKDNGDFIIESFVFNISEKKEYEISLKEKKEELAAYNQQLQAYNEETTAINEELEESFTELEKLNERFENMVSLVSDIDNLNTISEAEFLSKILQQAVEIIYEADYGSVYTFGENHVNFIDCVGYDLKLLKNSEIPNQAFYNHEAPIEIIDIEEVKKRNKKYMRSDKFKELTEISLNKHKEIMYFNLIINGEKKAGISLDIKNSSDKSFTNSSKKLFSAFYNIASSFYKLKEYNNLQDDFTKELISATVKMLEMYDLYTRGHSENVAELAVEIAEAMELEQKRIDDIYWAGLVHDLGKMLIPLEILNKEGKLSKSEYEIIKEHPVLGSNVLESSNSLKQIAKFVRHHHERWDGRGYPDGLKKDEIPLESLILCAADSWDAMRSKRTYRDPLSFNEALTEIKKNRASQFSPKVVDVLLEVLKN